MSAHSGPPHDSGCLALFASGARCVCSRRDWLREMVPRHQARRELLEQLANWAHEQRIFAGSEIESRAAREKEPGTPGWLAASNRAAARMAEEVFFDVRRRALAMQEECTSAAKGKPAAEERPVETVEVQEALL